MSVIGRHDELSQTPSVWKRADGFIYSESLILAQNERWQRGLGMQVEREYWCSNTAIQEWRKGEERVGNLPPG